MALPVGPEDLQKLKGFIDFVTKNPTILNAPQLEFVKTFIEKFGGTVPSGEYKMPAGGGCPFGGDAKTEPKFTEPESEPESEEMEELETESELELDMEGVIEGDAMGDQPMGDSSKIPTEEEMDAASDLRSQAAAAYGDQKYQEAIDIYTKAIELNPGNALFYAKRGQAYLKLQKPNACIRDCDKALELNCDSAASYKFRGRAHRLLGNWESAAKDLRQACKLDFDEETDEWLREVTPNAKKIEQHRIKQERKKADKELRMREERVRKAQEANKKAREQQQKGASTRSDGPKFPSFNGAEQFLDDPELLEAIKDIAKNPKNIEKYKKNPKFEKFFKFASQMGADNIPSHPKFDFARANKEFGNEDDDTASQPEPTAAESEAAATTKKADFVDDGLD